MKMADSWAINSFYAIVILNFGASIIGYFFGFWLGVAVALVISFPSFVWFSRKVGLPAKHVAVVALFGEMAIIGLLMLSNFIKGLEYFAWKILWFMFPTVIGGAVTWLLLWIGTSQADTFSMKDTVKRFHLDEIWIMIGIFVMAYGLDSILQLFLMDGNLLLLVCINVAILYLLLIWSRLVELDRVIGYVFTLDFFVLVWMDKGVAFSARQYSFYSYSIILFYLYNVPASRLLLVFFLVGFALRIRNTGLRSLLRLSNTKVAKDEC